MLGSSQQAGWGKKPPSPTKGRTTFLQVVIKAIYTIVLLTITAVTGVTENIEMSVTVGDSSVLSCPNQSNISLLTWRISPKVGGPCTLGYRADINTTDRTNCSDSINWKFRPDLSPDLEIQQVGTAQEGNYICEVVTPVRNFRWTYHLTVLVPPRLSLYCDEHGNAVCEAAAGKPPAQVSWLLQSNSSLEEKSHNNGTVTVLSRLTACNTSVTDTTCMVFHPTGDWSESMVCCSSEIGRFHCVISLVSLLSLLFLQAVFQLYTFCGTRTMRN